MRPNRNHRSASWTTIDDPRERVHFVRQIPFHKFRPQEQDEVEDFLSPEVAAGRLCLDIGIRIRIGLHHGTKTLLI